MEKNGYLVISLDFELLWGVFDKVSWEKEKHYFINTRNTIPIILDLFSQYDVSCTWATVGMLFNENWEEWNRNIPGVLPQYDNPSLSAFDFGKSIQSKETEDLCFAPDLLKLIQKTPGQEVGSHTYSHYYCLEDGQTVESFRCDLQKSKEMAENFGINLTSLVFPRNQFNPYYLEECRSQDLSVIRTNPKNWYWQNVQKNSLQQKIFRTADAYFGAKDKSYKLSEVEEINPGLLEQKASRFLRPFSSNSCLNKAKLNRIMTEMSFAARNSEVYHLWWHPHNFGKNPEENLQDLRLILDHFNNCRDSYGFKSLSMGEVAKKCRGKIHE